MTADVKLTQDELTKVIRGYLATKGYSVDKVRFEVSQACDYLDRPTGHAVTAVAEVRLGET